MGQKNGFLSWLAGPASLLNERTDHSLAFTHLSFQEFLAAWNRSRALEGDDRGRFAVDKAETTQWWETLRLWAALVEGQQGGDVLEPVLDKLLESDAGSAVAGTMLADDLGSEYFFERWAPCFAERIRPEYFSAASTTAKAWAASLQKNRRDAIPHLWSATANGEGWLGWLRLERWGKDAEVSASPARPDPQTQAGRLLACLDDGPSDEADFAIGRILCGADPAWPGEPWEVALLNTWPGHRRLAALRIQSLIAAGAERSLVTIGPSLLDVYSCARKTEEQALSLGRYFAQYVARDWVQDWTRDWARYFASYLARFWARYLVRDWAEYWIRNLSRDRAQHWGPRQTQRSARGLALDLADNSPEDWVWRWAEHWAKNMQLDPSEPAQIDFALWEIVSLGRPAARSRLALLNTNRNNRYTPPAVHLLSAAARLSLSPSSPTDEFDKAAIAYETSEDPDPLWPALARHLARRSTPEDKTLLTDLARHPEKRDPPLSWGLKYIVRGDILLENGTVVTLDELCDQHNLPHFPYLEDLPPEIDID